MGNENFGARLRRLRKERGWSIREFAEKAKTTTRLVSYYENGHCFPGFHTLLELGAQLDVTLDYMMRGEE